MSDRNIEVLQAPSLAMKASVRHGFFTRQGGVSEGVFASLNCDIKPFDDPALTAENRRRASAHLGASPDNLVCLLQVHGAEVVEVTRAWPVELSPEADALVTRARGIVLGILTADCAPVLLLDAAAGVIAAAHAGWRSVVAGVLENVVTEMEKLGASRSAIHAAVGPCIWQDSYEVDDNFQKPFLDADARASRFFKSAAREGHKMFDLAGIAAARLEALGLASVSPSMADTYAEPKRFYSYRRACENSEGQTGRLLSAIMLSE